MGMPEAELPYVFPILQAKQKLQGAWSISCPFFWVSRVQVSPTEKDPELVSRHLCTCC